jgi:hypothetical protein
MTSSQQWLLVILVQELYAHSSIWTPDPPDDAFSLRGLSIQAKR